MEYFGLYCASYYVTNRDDENCLEKHWQYCSLIHPVCALESARATFRFYDARGSSVKIRFVTQKEKQDQRQETEEANNTKDIEGATQESQS
jgi:hypothetical protein